MKVIHVVGARPNFMKIAPIFEEMEQHPHIFRQILVHTGQHYDDNMSKVFFEDLNLPQPDIYLGVGPGSHAQQTARIMMAFEPLLLEYKPSWIIVVGDVNSTVACALTATKLGIKVAHVEAGLRSFDLTMPEEINRKLTDQIADLLFTTEQDANKNLRSEGISVEKIHFVGNVMIDTFVRSLPKAEERWNIVSSRLRLGHKNGDVKRYILVTLHRPSNVDKNKEFSEIMLALSDIAHEVPVIFPVHPRTRKNMEKGRWQKMDNGNLSILEPLGYLDFLALMRQAALIITDSGGIQEETTYLGVPCLTVRPNTEHPVTINCGTNRFVANRRSEVVHAARSVLNDQLERVNLRRPKLWDGHAAQRIVNIFRRLVEKQL